MFEIFSIAGLFGFMGLVFGIAQMQTKFVKNIYIFDVLINFSWATHFFLIDAKAGAVICTVSILRGLSRLFIPDRLANHSIIALTGLSCTVILYNYTNLFSLLPLIGSILISAGMLINNRKGYTNLYALHLIFWLVYNIENKSLFGTIDVIFNAISCLIGKIRHEGFKFKRPAFLSQLRPIQA